MLSRMFRAALIALYIASATAKRELSLSVSGPEAVDGVANLKVKTTVTNSGDETLKILNDVRGPLSTLPTDTFDIHSSAGITPLFTGIKAKYVPAQVIADGEESSFTTLAPGESVALDHDLSQAYNFSLSDAGDYSITAKPWFTIVDDSGKTFEIAAKTESLASRVSGTLAVAREEPHLSKRASYRSCSSSQRSTLVSAASAAQSYASESLSYLNGISGGTSRYTTWFGSYTSSRHSTARSHFSSISAGSYSSFTYDCSCTDSGTYAYVYPNQYGVIYLCGVFWRVSLTGTDSQAGTLIHESSHFTANGGTDDYVYGQTNAKALAVSNPYYAVRNADNHEYFAENTPRLD